MQGKRGEVSLHYQTCLRVGLTIAINTKLHNYAKELDVHPLSFFDNTKRIKILVAGAESVQVVPDSLSKRTIQVHAQEQHWFFRQSPELARNQRSSRNVS